MADRSPRVLEFNGHHKLVLSPLVLYLPESLLIETRPFGVPDNDKRAEVIISLHGAIDNQMSSGSLRTEYGEFYVRRLYGVRAGEEYVARDDSCWGGDGIAIDVDSSLSGQELSAIFKQSSLVIYQPSTKKHYYEGHEVKLSANGQQLRCLWSI